MNHNLVKAQASSYALAGVFILMLVTFVAFDLHAVRREAAIHDEATCQALCTRGPTLPPQPLRVVFRDL